MPLWVSGRQREDRGNMAKEEVVENKYAGRNIFLSFSSSSHLFFPAFSLAVLAPPPSDVRSSLHLFFPAFSLAVLAPPPSDVRVSHSQSHVLNNSPCTVLWLPCAAYSSILKMEAACSCTTSGNLYQSTVLHPRTQHPSLWYFLLHLNSIWQVLNQTMLLRLTSTNTSPYLKRIQYIKDVIFKIFFLNGLSGDSNFQHQGRDC